MTEYTININDLTSQLTIADSDGFEIVAVIDNRSFCTIKAFLDQCVIKANVVPKYFKKAINIPKVIKSK